VVLVVDISVVIPAHNEEKTVGHVIERVFSVLPRDTEIVLVDDGSTDRTPQIAREAGARVIRLPRNMGKGVALRTGFKAVSGEIVITLDSDGTHRGEECGRLLQVLEDMDAEMVIGSRFLKPVNNGCTRGLNVFLNRAANMMIRLAHRTPITDSQSGMRAMRRYLLESLELTSIGYEIETEITLKALKNGYRVVEIPIFTNPRFFGGSKLNLLVDTGKMLNLYLHNLPSLNHNNSAPKPNPGRI